MKDGIVARTIAMLGAFADGEPTLAISQLSERLNMPPSSVHRLLEQLIKLDVIERANHRRYRIGPELVRICMKSERKFRIVDVARPLMHKLSDELNESCVLSVLLRSKRKRLRVLTCDPPRQPLKMKTQTPDRHSLVWGAAGRSMLAYLTEEEIKAAYDGASPTSITGKPLFSRRWLKTELESVRTKGFAIAHGELLTAESVAIAAPFFGPNRQVLGAIGVVIADFNFSEEMIGRISSRIMQTTRELTSLFGGSTIDPYEQADERDEKLGAKSKSDRPEMKLPLTRYALSETGKRKVSKAFGRAGMSPGSKTTH